MKNSFSARFNQRERSWSRFQANDPYVTDFTLAILRFQENGFLANLERKWWESSSGCPKEQDTGKII